GLLASAPESGVLAAAADPGQDVVLVPAFVGLGAPHWQPEARGALFGLTRATTAKEIAPAALEAVGYQTRDLLEAMGNDWSGDARPVLRVDGGMAASDWTMQFLADVLYAPVERPSIGETTALGAAWLAGNKAGVWPDAEGFARRWRLQRRFPPTMPPGEGPRQNAPWQRSLAAGLGAIRGRGEPRGVAARAGGEWMARSASLSGSACSFTDEGAPCRRPKPPPSRSRSRARRGRRPHGVARACRFTAHDPGSVGGLERAGRGKPEASGAPLAIALSVA